MNKKDNYMIPSKGTLGSEIRHLQHRFYRKEEKPEVILKELEELLKKYPNSAKLWIMRGDMIQLLDEMSGYSLQDARDSYIQALELDPDNIEAHQELGYWFNVADDNSNPSAAATHILEANDLALKFVGGGVDNLVHDLLTKIHQKGSKKSGE